MFARKQLDLIDPNPWQTRQAPTSEEYIQELAEDIRKNGLMQTPVARQVDGSERVQLAFGHNRLAAYRWLEKNYPDDDAWSELSLEIWLLTDEEMADMAWSENEKRRDHTPLDRALAIQQRIADFGWTHEQVAEHLGISRAVVSNSQRLLNLPENIRSHLNNGLPERTAIALLGLFDLPAEMRRLAENQVEYSWDSSISQTRPSRIVEAALGGESSEGIRKRVDALIGKFGEKLSAAPWKYADDFNRLLFGIELPEDYSTQFRSPACTDCPLRMNEHICQDRECYRRKEWAWKLIKLHAASQATGIPYLEPVEEARFQRSSLNEWNTRQYAEAIRATKCDNLRLVYTGATKDKNAPDSVEKHPFVRVICQKRNGACSCRSGLVSRDRSTTDAMQASRAARESQAPQKSQEESKPLVEVFEQEELKEAAREARRQRKDSLARIPEIQQQAIILVTQALLEYDPLIWQQAIHRISWKVNADAQASLNHAQISELIAQALVLEFTPDEFNYRNDPDPADYVRRHLDAQLRMYGVTQEEQS